MPWSLDDTPIQAVLPHPDSELDTQSILPQVQHHDDCNCGSSKLWPALIYQNGGSEPEVMSNHDEPASINDTSDVDEYDDAEEEDRNDEGVNNQTDEIYSRVMKIKGSAWQEIFQQNLRFIRKFLQNSNSCVSLSFQCEPLNPEDCNAILVLCNIGDTTYQLGYVPGPEIAGVRRAMKAGHIISISVIDITVTYGKEGLFYMAKMRVCKKGKWDKKCKNYVYNMQI
jgi:hypothetical protein